MSVDEKVDDIILNEYSDVMVFEEYAVEKYNGEKNEIK